MITKTIAEIAEGFTKERTKCNGGKTLLPNKLKKKLVDKVIKDAHRYKDLDGFMMSHDQSKMVKGKHEMYILCMYAGGFLKVDDKRIWDETEEDREKFLSTRLKIDIDRPKGKFDIASFSNSMGAIGANLLK